MQSVRLGMSSAEYVSGRNKTVQCGKSITRTGMSILPSISVTDSLIWLLPSADEEFDVTSKALRRRTMPKCPLGRVPLFDQLPVFFSLEILRPSLIAREVEQHLSLLQFMACPVLGGPTRPMRANSRFA